MDFTSCLPREAQGKRFSVLAPDKGLESTIKGMVEQIDRPLHHDARHSDMPRARLTLDLQVMWEQKRLFLRVFVNGSEDLFRHPRYDKVYLLISDLGVLLHADGSESNHYVHVSGYVSTEPTVPGTSSGMLNIWSASSAAQSAAS